MSFFYFPQILNFSPHMYAQFLHNQYQLACNTIPLQRNLVSLKNQQHNFVENFYQEQESSEQQIEQAVAAESNREGTGQKAQKIKKKRGIDKQKQLESAKKNSQSNIINQFFSYFSCRSQSQQIVQRAILLAVRDIEQLQKIVSIFYNIMKCMSMQRIKKYVNKKTLLNVFAKENIEKQIPEIVQKFKSLNFITIEQITEVIRRCCFYFLRNISLISVLASKRISSLSKREHLKKRRQLCGIVSGKL